MARNMDKQTVFNCLVEIYESLTQSKSISISKIIRKHQTGSYILQVLIEGGIIKKFQKGKYEWCSIEPNMHMVEKVIEKTSVKNKEARLKYIADFQKKASKSSSNNSENLQQQVVDKVEIAIDQFAEYKNQISELNEQVLQLMQDKDRLIPMIYDNSDKVSEYEAMKERVGYLESKLDKVSIEWFNKRKELEEKIETYKDMINDFKNSHPEYTSWHPNLGWAKTVSPFFENNEKSTKENSVNIKEFSLLWGLIKVKR